MPPEVAPPASPARRSPWGARGLGIAALVVLVSAGAATAGLWHVSSSPRLCNACHIMRPYVEAWKASPHAAVACVQCHYPPGFRDTVWVKYQALSQVVKWATHTYSSKPFAEVEDGSCLRSGCHDRTRLAGARAVRGGVRFDHARHLGVQTADGRRGPELRCTSCHTQVVVSTHIEVATSTCFLCHFKGGTAARHVAPLANCTGCHDTPRGDVVVGGLRFNHEEVRRRGVACQSCHLGVVEGDGAAPRERCLSCHNEPAKLARFGDQPSIHAAHVTRHNVECGRCHSNVRHALPPPIGVSADAADTPPSRWSASGS